MTKFPLIINISYVQIIAKKVREIATKVTQYCHDGKQNVRE